MSNNQVKESTEKYIDIVLQQTEDKAGISMTESMIESTTFIEKLSSSLLIVSGAAITLSIGNSEAVISALGKGSFKALIVLLLVSAISGFLAKASHALSIMFLNLSKDINLKFEMIFNKFDKFEKEEIDKVKHLTEIETRSPSLERIKESFISTQPSFIQKKISKRIATQEDDPKKMQLWASTLAYFHVMFFGGQALFTIVAFCSAVLGVE